MNQKTIGYAIIIIGVLIAGFVYMSKAQEDKYIDALIDQTGTCYLADGTCLHADRDYTLQIFGGIIAIALIMLGVYLSVFDKTQQILVEHQVKVSKALKDATKKDEFKAFLSGFGKDDQKILSAIRDQDGIKQSTLMYKTGMSKTGLSLAIKDLEKRKVISRKKSGKTFEVFLRKKF